MKKLGMILFICGTLACGVKTGDKAANANSATGGSLYERLGGTAALRVVVDDFVNNVVADDLIRARFANADLPAFKDKLVDQLCMVTGGPCRYTGKSMKEAHAGMKLSEGEFTALVNDLKKALDKNHVGNREQADLLGGLAAMHDDVVNQ